MEVFDHDAVSDENLPNQFFKVSDINRFKVDALVDIVREFTGVFIKGFNAWYVAQPLEEVVIVSADSMAVRWAVWLQFLSQERARIFIDARMGAEVGRIYIIRKHGGKVVSDEDIFFYKSNWYTDEASVQLPCTAKSIIYNVQFVASFIALAIKNIINGAKVPREIAFGLGELNESSFMVQY